MFNMTGQNTSFNRFPMGAGRTGMKEVKLPVGLILIIIHMGAAGIAAPVILSYSLQLRMRRLGKTSESQNLLQRFNALIR